MSAVKAGKLAARPPRASAASEEAYSATVDSAQLRNIRLIMSDFNVEPESLGTDRRAWKFAFGCELTDCAFDPERKVINGLVTGSVDIRLGRKKIVSLKCNYIAAYDVVGEPEAGAAKMFAERVGKFAVYPYFRAQFAELTAQAGLNLAPLPVLKEGKRVIPSAQSVLASTEVNDVDSSALPPKRQRRSRAGHTGISS